MSSPGLDGWLGDHLHEIEEAQAFSVDDIPDEPARLGQQLSNAQALYARMGFLLSDMEGFVLAAHATAVLETRKSHPELAADERRVIAKSNATLVQCVRFRDNLAHLVAALKQRSFAIMNHRNNACDPAMSGEQPM